LLFLTALSRDANGFGFEPSQWPQGSQVVVKLGFGPTPIQLQDGLASWDASAADTLDIWNGYLDFVSATSTSAATVPQVPSMKGPST
jgi:hypothetical protein